MYIEEFFKNAELIQIIKSVSIPALNRMIAKEEDFINKMIKNRNKIKNKWFFYNKKFIIKSYDKIIETEQLYLKDYQNSLLQYQNELLNLEISFWIHQ